MGILISDYTYRPRPRRAHPKLARLIEAGAMKYEAMLREFLIFAEDLQRIPVAADPADPEMPHWNNDWLPALDGISLYGLIASRRPRLFLEIGSGISTRFARYAIRTNRLETRIVSIDPMPRAHVDSLCDETIREPLEDADLCVFNRLAAGDMIFLDSSHRAFQNSDATVFFTEILPGLRPGVVYGIHDIFLPFDYGEPTLSANWPDSRLPESREAVAARFAEFIPRFYNEQYLLASYLLGGAGGDEIVLPCAWISSQVELLDLLSPIWRHPGFESLAPWGGAYWAMRR